MVLGAQPVFQGKTVPTADHEAEHLIRAQSSARNIEQSAESRRLRAQILIGRFHARTEVSRGMPRPTRVVEHGACERDEIRIALQRAPIPRARNP